MTGVVMAANVYAGRLARRFGARRVMLFAAALAAAGCAGLLGVDASTPYGAMVVQMVVLGAAIGLIVPLMTSALMGSVDRSQSGIASGTLNTLRQTGSVVGVALFGSLFATSVIGGLAISIALLLTTGALAASMP
jgi:DHA2 family methylenomycin A resistance protein-like MFS transporter